MIEEEDENSIIKTPRKIWIQLDFKPNQEYSKEENNLLQSMAQYLERKIWKWDIKDTNFTFSLPKTIFTEKSQLGFVQHANQEVVYLNEENMNKRSLTEDILNSIWTKGSFKIESQAEGLPYVWQLSQLIVKGYENIIDTLWSDMSSSFFFIYTVKDRFTCDNYQGFAFSFPSSFYSMYCFLWETTNLLIGLPCLVDNYSEIEIQVTKKNLIAFFEANTSMGEKMFINKIVNKLYIFDNQFDEFWKKELLIKEKDYTSQGMPTSEKMLKLFEERNSAYIDFLEKNKEFNDLNDVYQCLSFILAYRVIVDIIMKKNEEIEQATKEYDSLLKQNYIRYRVSQWKDEQMALFIKTKGKEVKKKTNKDIQNGLRNFEMPWLFYRHHLSCEKEFKAKFELEKRVTPKIPQSIFTITKKCSKPYERYYVKGYNNEDLLRLRKQESYEVQSSFAFWRVWVFILKFIIYTFNIGLSLLQWGLNSSIGLKALFYFELYQDEEFGADGEVIEVNKSWTFPKSLSNLMIWITESRESFEEQPDTGLFGKSFGRVLNVLYNYVIKLVFIGLALLLFYPSAIIVNVAVTTALFFASPFLGLIAVISEFLWNVLCYDTKHRGAFILPLISYLFWYLIIKGIIQLIMVIVCLIFQPILSSFMLIFAMSRFCLRLLYDSLMFSILKCIGKVPVTDSGFAWKTSGPGITYDHYAQISNEEMLKFVHATLEKLQLSKYYQTMSDELDQPLINFNKINQFLSAIKIVYSYNSSISESITHFKSILNQEERIRRELYPSFGRNIVKYSKANLEFVKVLTKKYLYESFSSENLAFVWNQYTLLEESWDLLTERILKDTFGDQIMESLEENDKVVHIECKTNSAMDLIAKTVFEDPQYSNKVIKEDRKEQKVANIPKFSCFKSAFSGNNNAFMLPLNLLSQKEKEKYLGKDNTF